MADVCPTSPAPYSAPGQLYQYDLYWIIDQLHKLLHDTSDLQTHDKVQDTHLTELDDATQTLKDKLTELAAKLANGDFSKGDFEQWALTNMPGIIQLMVRFVFFGLTDDGHFVVYIPQSWEFLHFDTILAQGDPMYGHLVIYY